MVNLKGKPVELRVPSRMGYEKVAMGTAASVAKLMGFPDARIEDLKTAIAEACINAIERREASRPRARHEYRLEGPNGS
jgi:serine/threonine-protein kinase RsbW